MPPTRAPIPAPIDSDVMPPAAAVDKPATAPIAIPPPTGELRKQTTPACAVGMFAPWPARPEPPNAVVVPESLGVPITIVPMPVFQLPAWNRRPSPPPPPGAGVVP